MTESMQNYRAGKHVMPTARYKKHQPQRPIILNHHNIFYCTDAVVIDSDVIYYYTDAVVNYTVADSTFTYKNLHKIDEPLITYIDSVFIKCRNALAARQFQGNGFFHR